MKRSSHVALLLMGAAGAGASAYAFMPAANCAAPERPAAVAPGAIRPETLAPGTAQPASPAASCDSSRRWRWRSGSHWSSRSWWGGSSASPSPVRTSTVSGSRVVAARGGFGSTGHSISAGS